MINKWASQYGIEKVEWLVYSGYARPIYHMVFIIEDCDISILVHWNTCIHVSSIGQFAIYHFNFNIHNVRIMQHTITTHDMDTLFVKYIYLDLFAVDVCMLLNMYDYGKTTTKTLSLQWNNCLWTLWNYSHFLLLHFPILVRQLFEISTACQ